MVHIYSIYDSVCALINIDNGNFSYDTCYFIKHTFYRIVSVTFTEVCWFT